MELREPHTHAHPEHHSSSQEHPSELEDDFDGASILPHGDEDTHCADIADVEVVVDHTATVDLSHQSLTSSSYQPSPHHHHINNASTSNSSHKFPPSDHHMISCSSSTSSSIGSSCASANQPQPHVLSSSRQYNSNTNGASIQIHHHRHLANHIPSVSSSQHHQYMQQQHYPQQQLVKQHLTQQCSSTSSKNSSPVSTPMTNISPNLSSCSSGSAGSSPKCVIGGAPVPPQSHTKSPQQQGSSAGDGEQSEIIRKRLYRVGLNMFNKKPENGITYLVKKKFLEGSAPAVSRFLISRKGLSKQMIGEYLANLQSPFSMACLE